MAGKIVLQCYLTELPLIDQSEFTYDIAAKRTGDYLAIWVTDDLNIKICDDLNNFQRVDTIGYCIPPDGEDRWCSDIVRDMGWDMSDRAYWIKFLVYPNCTCGEPQCKEGLRFFWQHMVISQEAHEKIKEHYGKQTNPRAGAGGGCFERSA